MQRVQPADIRPHLDIPLRAPTPGGAETLELRDPLPEPGARVEARSPVAERPPLPQRRDRRAVSPFQAAFLFSAFWLAALGAYGVGLLGPSAASAMSPEWMFGVAAVAVIPVALVLFAALVMTEARGLRQQALALSTSTQNLLRPDEHAARNVQRLSHAIKRELDQLTTAIDAASRRLSAIESSANERIALIERTATAAQERVETATGKLGTEREKLAQFTQALDSVVLAASETLTTRLQDARAAVRTASESLHAEHNAIAGLVSTLQSASHAVSSKALETSQELERQAQRLDSASEAAAARSEQVLLRHERQRAAFAETIDRLKQENDHMARAIDFQREGMNKLLQAMAEETRKISTLTSDGARCLEETSAGMAMRIMETTKLFARESDKLRTSTELTMSGLEQAVQSIKVAGDSSFDAAGRLGSVLVGLRDTAAGASQQIEANVGRLSKMLGEMPSEAAHHVKLLSQMIDQQARSMQALNARVAAAFDRVQGIELARGPSIQPGEQASPAPLLLVQPAQASTPAPAVRSKPSLATVPSVAERAPDAGGPVAPQAGYAQNRGAAPSLPERPAPTQEGPENRGWLNMARRLVRPASEDGDGVGEERGNWDMKSLLAAAETKEAPERRAAAGPAPSSGPQFKADPREIRQMEHVAPRQPAPQLAPPQAPRAAATPAPANPTPARHMMETLQAIAIDLCRFLEDDPPNELLKRYRNGERNVFARRLAGSLGSEQQEMIGQKYRSDREFRDTVDRYVQQFEALLEMTARNDRDNVLVETYLSSQTGKVYMTLASAIGRLS